MFTSIKCMAHVYRSHNGCSLTAWECSPYMLPFTAIIYAHHSLAVTAACTKVFAKRLFALIALNLLYIRLCVSPPIVRLLCTGKLLAKHRKLQVYTLQDAGSSSVGLHPTYAAFSKDTPFEVNQHSMHQLLSAES